MKRSQTWLGLLLVCSMLLSLLPVPALAVEQTSGTCGEHLTWALEDGTLTISGTGEMNDYDNPISYPSDHGYAPWYKSPFVHVVIEDGVTSIGSSAFAYSNMSSIDIPESVVKIGQDAFFQCDGLRDITIPSNIAAIESGLFSSCDNLSHIDIPEGVTRIGGSAFYGCTSLSSIIIPEGVTEIGVAAFSNCTSLSKVIIPGSVSHIGGIQESIFSNCTQLESAGPIGGGYDCEFGWTETIPENAFSRCNTLRSITIPAGVTSIGENAFYKCENLSYLSIPESVTSIGNYAFIGCTSLTSAGPIGGGYAYEFGWTESIPKQAFSACSEMSQVILPDGITRIGDGAFGGCGALSQIDLPNSITEIGMSAFSGCSLDSVDIPEGMTSIGFRAFSYCGARSITIPDSVTRIESYAFEGCDLLERISIPNSVKDIWDRVFYECSSLNHIIIPDSVISIDLSVFEGCSSLADLYYAGSKEQWDSVYKSTSEKNPLADVTIHYNSTGPGSGDTSGTSKVLLLLEDAETGEPCFENPVDRIPDFIDKESLRALVGSFVWVTYDSAAQTEIVNIQALESQLGTLHSISEGSLIVNGQLYPHTVSLPFLEDLEGQEVVYHVLDGTVVAIQQPVKESGKLETWDAGTGQVKIGENTYYTNGLTDEGLLDCLEPLRGWEVEYLHVGPVVLRIAAELDSETEGAKRFQRYDESTNTVYFTDNTSYCVADGAALDFTGLENRWVRYTLRYTEDGPRLTEILRVEPTIRVEVFLEGGNIEYQGGKLRFEGREWEDKASFEIPVAVRVTNNTALSGVKQSELREDDTLAVTVEQVEVTAPEGFNFGWFGGGTIKLDSPVTLQVGDTWGSDQDGRSGYLRAGSTYRPAQAENEYPVTAVAQTSIGAQQGTQSLIVVDLDESSDEGPEPEEPGSTETLTYWEREFLGELYQVEDIAVTGDNSVFALSEFFDQSTIEDIGRLAVYWSSVLGSNAAKNTQGELSPYLKITCTMTEGRYQGHKATLIFHYRSYLNWFFATMDEISFVLVDNQTRAVLMEPQLHSFSVSASAKDFADGIQGYLQVKFGEDLEKFCQKLGTKAIKEMVKDVANMTGEEYLNTLLALVEDIDKIAKNAQDFTDYAGKASAILRNPIKASVSSAEEFNNIGAKFVSAACPVDVYIYNPEGELCGAVENDAVVVDTTETFLRVSGSEKRIWLNDDYTLKLVATDVGTMDYTITEYSGSTNTRTVYFEDVPLEPGLVYEGAVPEKMDIPSAEYALQSNQGTVVYADRDTKARGYTITFDPNGGTAPASSRTMETGMDGRLAELPASPTRSGYLFNGWYTSASGGTKIDTGYVFRADTTVYAQWSASSTGGSGSGPIYYDIRLPETSHGYISASHHRAEWGTAVELWIHPDSGYELDTLWVTNARGDEIAFTERDIDRYSFSMPASWVEVDAIFTRRSTWSPSTNTTSSTAQQTVNTVTTPQSIPTPQVYGLVFSDVPTGHWAAGTIAWAYQNGYMNGVGGGRFSPEDTMTNQQLWMVISRLMGHPAADLDQASKWAANTGLANGRRPASPLTRQEMANDLYRTAFLMGVNLSNRGSLDGFSDRNQLRGDARDIMSWAVASGIITGTDNGRLNPNYTVTRAQFATILYRFHYTTLQ